MDPLAILQSRIEQLEAKLGVAANSPIDGQQGDSATMNLMNTAQTISNATAGHEKLSEAMQMANELNNYTDPNFVEKVSRTCMVHYPLFYRFNETAVLSLPSQIFLIPSVRSARGCSIHSYFL